MREPVRKTRRGRLSRHMIGGILLLTLFLCVMMVSAVLQAASHDYRYYLMDELKQSVTHFRIELEQNPRLTLQDLNGLMADYFDRHNIADNPFNTYHSETVGYALTTRAAGQDIVLSTYSRQTGLEEQVYPQGQASAAEIAAALTDGQYVFSERAEEGTERRMLAAQLQIMLAGQPYVLQTSVSAVEPLLKALPSMMLVVISVLLIISLLFFFSRNSSRAVYEQVTRSEARLQRILDNLNTRIHIIRPESDEILFMNAPMREEFGLTEEQLVGKVCWQVMQLGLECHCPECPGKERLDEAGGPIIWEEYHAPSGHTYLNRDFLIEWDDGSLVHMQQSDDITENRNAIDMMARQVEQQKLLAQVSLDVGTDQKFQDTLDGVLLDTAAFLDADRAFLLRHEVAGEIMAFQSEWCREGLRPIREVLMCLPYDERMHIPSSDAQQLRRIDTPEELPTALRAPARMLDVRSLVVVPVRLDGKQWGLLCYCTSKRTRTWNEQDLSLMRMLGGILSVAAQRNLAQQQLGETQRTLASIMEHIPLGIYWKDKNSRYLGCNQKFGELMGIDPLRVPGKMDVDLFPENSAIAHMSGDQEAIVTGNVLSDFIMSSMRPDADKLWLSRKKLAVYDDTGEVVFILGIMEDVSQRMRAESKRDQTLAQLQGVMDYYPGVIWSLDDQYRCTLAGGFLYDQNCRLPTDAWIGLTVDELYSDLPEVIAYSKKTYTDGPQHFNVEYANMSFSFYTAPMYDEHGRVYGIVTTSMDVSTAARLQRELEEAIIVAEKASGAKSDFLSRMSHEIRTPMNVIIGMCRIALRSDDPAKVKHSLNQIDSSAKHLLGLINDILDMSKIEANKLELHEDVFNMEQLLKTVSNNIMVRVEERNQTLQVLMAREMSHWYVGDELRLSQVLTNLFTNAIKFSPDEGNIVLSMKELERNDDVATLEVRVRDHGIGMTQDQIDKLFQSFEQADGGIARKYGGTGLGLAICKSIVGMMNGQIWVESEPGKGSTFIFTVQMKVAPAPAIPLEKEAARKGLPPNLRVLVIDDSLETCEHFKSIMDGFGIACDQALSGEEALRCAAEMQKQGKAYDILFVDWRMPDMDGIETIRRLHGMLGEKVLVIMISGADLSEVKEDAMNAGVHHFVPKPLFPSEIFNVLTSILNVNHGTIPVKETAVTAAPDLNEYTVLLAEDMEFNREVAISMLEETGCQVDIARDGLEAVETFRQDPLRFGCILMDMQMPEMDGLQATRAIRALDHPWAKKVPIVAMTANVFRDDIDQCLEAGMDDHIGKPIEDSTLYEKLAFYLHKSATNALEQPAEPKPAAVSGEAAADFLPYVNVKAGLAKLRNNRKLFATLLGSFQRNTKYQEMTQAITESDFAQAVQCAASLKGTVANIMLEAFAKQLTELELTLKTGMQPRPEKLLQLEETYQKTEAAIPRVIEYLNRGNEG